MKVGFDAPWGQEPYESIGLGAWYLLVELRRKLCVWLQPRLPRGFDEILAELIDESARLWREQLPRAEGCRLAELSKLVPYLEHLSERLEQGTSPPLEELFVPRLELYDRRWGVLRWWLPPESSLGAKGDDELNSLFPHLNRAGRAQLRRVIAPGIPVTAPVGHTDIQLADFRSRERIFLPRLVGSTFPGPGDEISIIDCLAGVGSECAIPLSDEQGSALGMLVLTSPIVGLMPELCWAGGSREPLESALRSARFVCCVTPTEGSWESLAQRGDGEEPWQRSLERRLRRPLAAATLGDPLVMCRTCADPTLRDQMGDCLFLRLEEWARPRANVFLSGLRNLTHKAELEQSKLVLRKITHTLTGPLSAAKIRYDEVQGPLLDDGLELPPGFRQILRQVGLNLAITHQLCRSLHHHVRRTSRLEDELRGSPGAPARPGQARGKVRISELRKILEEIREGPWLHSLHTPRIEETIDVEDLQQGEGDGWIVGSVGDWALIFYTLMKNALEAAHRVSAGRDRGFVEVKAGFDADTLPDDLERHLTLKISNTSPHIPEPRFLELRDCLEGKIPTVMPNPRKPESVGVGLAVLGETLRFLDARAELHQDRSGCFSVTIKGVEVHAL